MKREEALRVTEYEMRECICEPEKGPSIGEEYNDDGMTRMVIDAYLDTEGYHGFNCNYLCVYLKVLIMMEVNKCQRWWKTQKIHKGKFFLIKNYKG